MIETKGGFLLSRVKRASGRVFEKLLTDSGVEAFNGAQGRILYVLWQTDGIPIAEIARRTSLASSTLTSMLDRMEAAGLVERVRDKSDRRRINIALTEASRSLEGEYTAVSMKMNELYYEGFTDSEILAFEADLERILANLTKHANGGNLHEEGIGTDLQ